jgi:ABC-type nitrate/sulfonate/bicarbonate transport system substrate-binding protein
LALMARPDWVDQNPKLATAAARAVSRGGALFHSNPEQAKAALRAHRFSDPTKLDEQIFNLAYSMVVDAIPRWGDMNQDGWQKVVSFATGSGIIKDHPKHRRPKKACFGRINTSANRESTSLTVKSAIAA